MRIKLGIVDDHQLFIDGIKSILANEMDVEIVAEATDATMMMRLIEQGTAMDVLMTDLRMPGMDGITFTKLITGKYPQINVLVLSMLDQTADVRDVLKSGAKGYIPKNISKQEMLIAIRTVSDGQTYFDDSYDNLVNLYPPKENSKDATELTKREIDILTCVARGRTSIEISEELHISKLTVDTHRKNIHKKLNLENQSELLKYAIEYFS